MNPPGLIVILGATATGKTQIAIELARRLHAPILSADSRQVYRRLDIGTAKPTLLERQGIPHYLIDINDPDIPLTLAEYQQQTQALIADFHTRRVTPILVGGTGLYIRAIVSGLRIPRVGPQTDLRLQFQDMGQLYCYAVLQQIDPIGASKIHPNDRVRTMRALEVFYVTGIPLSVQQLEVPPSYPIVQIGISTPETLVYRQWIGDRIDRMLQKGWLDEIVQLQKDYTPNLPLLQTLGYAEMATYLAGETDLATARELAITHTYQFAKQQKTWFRGIGNAGSNQIHWVSQEIEIDELLNLIHDGKDRQIHPNEDRTDHAS